MNLTTARAWVRDSARNAGDSSMYTDARIDRAIQSVGQRFCRLTRSIKDVVEATLASGDPTVAISVDDFRAERLIDVHAEGVEDPLSIMDWSYLWHQKTMSATTGKPSIIAFEVADLGEVWPTPSADYDIRLRYWKPFTTWTPGTSDLVTLNIPDEWLAELLPKGPTALLQFNEPEHAYASKAWQDYLLFEATIRGAGGGASKILTVPSLN